MAQSSQEFHTPHTHVADATDPLEGPTGLELSNRINHTATVKASPTFLIPAKIRQTFITRKRSQNEDMKNYFRENASNFDNDCRGMYLT